MNNEQKMTGLMNITNQPNWEEVCTMVNINRAYVQLGASQFLASHPKHVRDAIARYSQALDDQPVWYTEEAENAEMQKVREAAAEYLGIRNPNQIANTDSTTMGLGMIYTALNIQPGQEIITTDHDHYSHHESIRHAIGRTGASQKRISLYENLSKVTKEEIITNVIKAIDERTRIIGLTWVHSSSGLKIPVPEIARALASVNKDRDEKSKVYMVLDAVHGFGIEQEGFPDLGCDFFISGCHKWLYGPRGTGIVAATHEAWQLVTPIIPSFTGTMDIVIEEKERPDYMDGKQMTPGGFHSLEYRWALADAFRFMLSLGKENVCQRVHYLNRLCKEGLAAMPHVKLHTPLDSELSSGIISFEIKGLSTEDTIKKLKEKKVVATASPYKTSWARFTPGIINTEEEIDMALDAVHSLKK
jgi:isopenicillin-N epimerase